MTQSTGCPIISPQKEAYKVNKNPYISPTMEKDIQSFSSNLSLSNVYEQESPNSSSLILALVLLINPIFSNLYKYGAPPINIISHIYIYVRQLYIHILQATLMMLSLLEMAWNVDECVDAGGDCCCSSEDGVESLSDRAGNWSSGLFWFKLRSAIFEDGGIGTIGTGRTSLDDFLFTFVCPDVSFSSGLSPLTGEVTELITVTGKVDIGNPPGLLLFKHGRGCSCGCSCGNAGVAVSWCTWSSSIDEPMNCKSKR